MPSDKIVLCTPHLSRHAGTQNKGKRLAYLMPARQPLKGLGQFHWQLKQQGSNTKTATALLCL